MPTTILSIPPEILHDILELGASLVEEGMLPRDTYQTRQYRRTFLYGASLVHPSWTCEAQACLWEEVYVDSETIGRRLLESPLFGRHQTKALVIQGPPPYADVDDDVSVKSVMKIVSGVVGISRLSLQYLYEPFQLSVGVLCSPNLKGLTCLDLSEVYLHHDLSATYTLPFSLRELSLCEYNTTMITPLSFFFSSTLADLSIVYDPNHDWSQEYTDDYFTLISSIAGQLHSLHLTSDTTSKMVPQLLPTFAHCTNLKRLGLHCDAEEFDTIINALPSTLFDLAVGMNRSDLCQALLSVLDKPCLAKLHTLRFMSMGCAKRYLVEDEKGRLLLAALKARKVQLIFGIKIDSEEEDV